MLDRYAGLLPILRSAPKLAAAAILLVLPSCDPGSVSERPAPPYGTSVELVVVSRNSPTTRYIGPDGDYVGFEQDLVELFARDAGLKLRVIERSRFSDILPTLKRRIAHLAAAGISITKEREAQFSFGPAYMTVNKVVAYNTDQHKPRDFTDLVGKR
ncbi:MAG: transporter substrate-binding domain-containing protein, partial [Burkholderiales bacterium]